MEKKQDLCLYQTAVTGKCHQAGNLAVLENAVGTIAKAVDEIKEGQRETTALMREIAVQGTKVTNIEARLDTEIKDRKHNEEILFNRVHEMEQAPAAAANSRWVGVWGVVAGAVVAFILEFWRGK